MKINDGYLLREVAGTYIVVPVGERVIEFKGMMTLNDTGAFIWRQLQSDCKYQELLTAVLGEYEVNEEVARSDLDEFLNEARESGVLQE